MAVPKSVLEAEEAADRIIAEMGGASLEDGQKPDSEGEAEAGSGAAGGSDDESAGQGGDAGAGAADTDVEQLRARITELEEELRRLNAAHDTLKGKTYAEVPRVLSENKVLRDEIASLKAQLEAKGTASAPAQVTGKAADILASLKEDVNEGVADRISMLVSAVVEEQITSRVKPVETTLEGIRAAEMTDRQQRYLARLTELVPDWRVVAADPEYSSFLQQKDEFSGGTLYDLASNALDVLDADRMAVFFGKYKEKKGTAKASVASAAAARASGKEALVAPRGTSKTSGRQVDDGSKPDYITTKQLEQFTKDRKKMSREEEAKWEARIDKAIQNGWIVPV